MTEKIKRIRAYIIEKRYKRIRRNIEYIPKEEKLEVWNNRREAWRVCLERKKERFCRILDMETPEFIPELRFIPVRTVVADNNIVNTNEELKIEKEYYLHEQGHVCNICPDYTKILSGGFEQVLISIQRGMTEVVGKERDKGVYAETLAEIVGKIYEFTDKYAEALKEQGREQYGEKLKKIIRHGAEHFEEALQLLRLLHYFGWVEGEYHIGIGRLDQYLYPYYIRDKKAGLREEEAFEMIEEFFLTFNIDNDLYPGVQMGDNGQSLMLGGAKRNEFNELSRMCLKASCELKMIDPKINLRVGKSSPLKEFVEGTKLTEAGLGFPQYSNDDVVIPALERWGYELEDAENYTVAACWEFIIPGRGMDIPNIEAVSFPKIINLCVEKNLLACSDMEQFCQEVQRELNREIDRLAEKIQPIFMFPAPYLSMMMEGCCEKLTDISQGGFYNNYGLHGTGVACAVDSLYAIEKYYYGEKRIGAEELIAAVKNDFSDGSPYLTLVRNEMPHMGDGEDEVDRYAVWLLDTFAEKLQGRKNERGGIYRPGTGSAMYYVQHARELGASPDGRRKGELFPANFSPSMTAKVRGPLSIIRSFTKPELMKVANGGPLTLEFHDSVFRGEEGIGKVAALVQTYIRMGGHQLQLNATNAEVLRDAQKNPQNYKNLIVRVWGWSAYFVELDKIYQDHLIKRAEYTV